MKQLLVTEADLHPGANGQLPPGAPAQVGACPNARAADGQRLAKDRSQNTAMGAVTGWHLPAWQTAARAVSQVSM